MQTDAAEQDFFSLLNLNVTFENAAEVAGKES
jgi:hypothetical protein